MIPETNIERRQENFIAEDAATGNWKERLEYACPVLQVIGTLEAITRLDISVR